MLQIPKAQKIRNVENVALWNPPGPDSQGTIAGSLANHFPIRAHDETGLISMFDVHNATADQIDTGRKSYMTRTSTIQYNSCHLKGLAVQIEALHCKNPKIRYAHKPFCSLCRIQRRHWTHTCYSRKRQKVASGVSQLDFFKTVLFCGDCCNRHSVHCANYSK